MSGRNMDRCGWMASCPGRRSTRPNSDPNGVQLPTIIAAMPMNPRPLVIIGLNTSTASSVNQAPRQAGDHTAEQDVDIADAKYLDAQRVGGLRCSPTARVRSPHGV